MEAFLSTIIASLLLITEGKGPTICADYQECNNAAQITNAKVECAGDYSCRYTPIESNKKLGYVKCSGEESCQYSTSLDPRDTVYCTSYQSCHEVDAISARRIYCGGHRACYRANLDARKLFCSAYAGCYNAQIRSDGDVNCGGKESCGWTTMLAAGDVDCAGEDSCRYATITSDKNIYCSTYQACEYATLTAGESVKLYGAYSGYSVKIKDTPLVEAYGDTALVGAGIAPIIDSGSLSTMTVKLIGTGSDIFNVKGTVICRNGAVCDLLCESSGCYKITYQCEAGATCNINPSGCSSNSGGTVIVNGGTINCPYMTTSTSSATGYEEEQQYDDDEEPLDHNGKLAAHASVICDTEKECEGDTITLSDGRVYCRGLESCANTTITNTYPYYDQVLCSGEKSCFASNIYAQDSIACSGERACKSSSRLRVLGSIECWGLESCADIPNIHWSAQYMECRGAASCTRSNILGNGYSVYVYCHGNRACAHSTIDSIKPPFCDGKYSCSSATLSVDANTYAKAIFCEATLSCNKATINPKISNAYVQSRGYLSSYGSLIYGENIRVESTGYRSSAYSTIDSKGGGNLRASFWGYQGGYGATFTCRKNTSCVLTCRGTSCENMDYLCESGAIECKLSPPGCSRGRSSIFAGVYCPTMITNIDEDEVETFLENKKIERENNEIYKQIEIMIATDDEEFESLMNYDYDDEQEEKENDLLFLGEIGVIKQSISGYHGVFVVGIIGVVVIMVIMIAICLWFLCGNNKKEYQPLK